MTAATDPMGGNHRDPADTPSGARKAKKARRFLHGYEATLVVTGATSPHPT
ncbi:hypothetical protein [Streptomyces sp. NPDC127033]|uniref:hypothetical protein n=1 Tax=Streptomyces sp. NPDC127033 TaxID=3347110 RepID=UPI00364E30F1